MANTFELSNVTQIGIPLQPGEELGHLVEKRPDIGCQFVAINLPEAAGRDPEDQVFIVVEPRGVTPFVRLTTDKSVSVRSVLGVGWTITHRESAGGLLEASMLIGGIADNVITYGQGDSLGFANAGNVPFVIRDQFDPHFEPSDEERPPQEIIDRLITVRGLAQAVLLV